MAQNWDKIAQFWGLKSQSADEDEGDVTPETATGTPQQSAGSVTPMSNYTGPSVVKGGERRVVTMALERYDGRMMDIAQKFRAGDPIIVNIEKADRAAGERIIDFASGLVAGLQGDISKISDGVLMLTPATVKVAKDSENSIRDLFDS